MKEITRRLYTKPFMLGMAFFVGLALVVGLFVTTNSTAMQSGFPVVAGNDEFETTANGESVHDFAGSPIPADFFGAGSLAYAGTVTLEGVPLNPAVNNTDTIIQRHQTVSSPGGSTALTMTALNLKGTGPIIVSFSNGTTQSWNVTVGLSQFKASTGTMTINSSSFDSTLKVWPRFSFTRNGVTKVLDTGGSGLTAASTTDASDSFAIGADAVPSATIAPCKAVAIDDFESRHSATAAASSSCPPLTLTATSPWFPCPPTGFCKPPLTEAERWARHNASPPGTKKLQQQQQQNGVAE
jgi:hypothetical protein